MTHIGAFANLQTVARALGGEVRGGQVRAPGPGHSPADRSLSIKPDSNAPGGFIVNSFANDDPIACKDYVREKIGLPAFKPNGSSYRHVSSDVIERAVMAAVGAQSRCETPKGRVVSTYNYTDVDGKLLYQVARLEPKDLASLLSELEDARLLALKLGQASAAVAATMGKAKITGHIIDRREVGDAGAFDDMTDEELISAAARKARELGIAGPREVEDAN